MPKIQTDRSIAALRRKEFEMPAALTMNWDQLLCPQRLGDDRYQEQPNRSIFAQDHDRIVFSAPFRRLANKTQVQPLHENDHIHHRLIHSIEVASVGRSLAMAVGAWAAETHKIEPRHVWELADIVQAACVAHDIGNPPFGHSGEEAIGSWFAQYFAQNGRLTQDLPTDLRQQFIDFEGNAQGFRIVTRLEMYRQNGGMRLSKATLGAFTKYPVTAADRQKLRPGINYIGLKKFGIFNQDQAQFQEVAEGLGLIALQKDGARYWARHPLVFLMEAADDITYNIVDLEDAYTTGELSFDKVAALLEEVAYPTTSRAPNSSNTEHIASLRARSIGAAITACVDSFITHYDAIMQGTFDGDLLGESRLAPIFERIRKIARDSIFNAPRKTELEVFGRRIITNVMNGLIPVYEDLAAVNWNPDQLSVQSQHLVRALSLDLRDAVDCETALHSLADFTSGMTDRYALRNSRMLSGV